MKIQFLLKDEFKSWLIESSITSKTSAKSYLSYVSGANKVILVSKKDSNEKSNLFTILQVEFEKQNIKAIEETILFVIEELSRKNADGIFGKAKKTLQNYRSGLYRYLEFLIEQPFFVENVEEDEITTIETQQIYTDIGRRLSENNTDIVFSKNDLRKNFSLRIKTQDRFYENIFFPYSIYSTCF